MQIKKKIYVNRRNQSLLISISYGFCDISRSQLIFIIVIPKKKKLEPPRDEFLYLYKLQKKNEVKKMNPRKKK